MDEIQKNIRHVADVIDIPAKFRAYMASLDIRPKVIYDIGGSVLHWHRNARQLWPQADVFVFEANTDVESLYQERGVEHYHMGVLTDQDFRELEFWKDPMNLGGNSYYRENTDAYEHCVPTHMVGFTLDTVVRRNRWPMPDLIKIDVQGAELDILRGASDCLRVAQNLLIECQFTDYNQGAPKVWETLEYLEGQGFELVAEISRTHVDGDYHLRRADK